jgi:hypothetical protein
MTLVFRRVSTLAIPPPKSKKREELFNIPGTARELAGGISADAKLADGTVQQELPVHITITRSSCSPWIPNLI